MEQKTETNIRLDHGWTLNLSGILALEFGTLAIITFFLWLWKMGGLL